MTAAGAALDNPYASFWMAGFEGADHLNAFGTPLDLVQANGHLEHLDDDYRRLADLGLRTVRETVGWRLAEPSTGRWDFDRALRMADAARRHGLQILWTLMHYGRPADVDVFDDAFAHRLADFAGAAARALHDADAAAPIYTPINEISFLAWAVAETNLIYPYDQEAGRRQSSEGARLDLGLEAKGRLVRGALAAMAAVRAEEPRARFLHVEPLIHIVPPAGEPHLTGRADEVAAFQWQSWDMLAGTLMPELGGSREALDLLGVNYYHNCQWEMNASWLEWHLGDTRRVSFASLLRKAWKRFDKPLLVSETSHIGSGRAGWMEDIASELVAARRAGVPVLGACLYPIIDRPDWNNAGHWHNSGLWDVDASVPLKADTGVSGARSQERKLDDDYARSLRRAQALLPATPIASQSRPHLIVFSHLRWNFVYGRPQQLLSRLLQHFHVVFIEEPLHSAGPAFLERTTPLAGLEVLCARTPVETAGFHDDQLPLLQPMLARYLDDQFIDDYLVLFTTPMALPLLGDLRPRLVLYDCMDELSAYRHAPRQMRQRETMLLKRAELVFAAGPSLQAAKHAAGGKPLLLASGVDAAHYASAPLIENGGAPRLGYLGVVDERLDIELLTRLADAEPGWHIVMAGPVVKIDASALPQRPNLHWVGLQTYQSLPALVAGWDVCLLPFALNESTRFICPTKTLEYLAAGKPVVATAINDVVSMYGELVAIAADACAFVGACRAALRETPAAAAERRRLAAACVEGRSWDAVAAAAVSAIDAALLRQVQGDASAPTRAPTELPDSTSDRAWPAPDFADQDRRTASLG